MTARAHARRTDPGTSHAAADSVRELTDRQRAVLAILRQHGPLTDEQLVARYTALQQLHDGAPPQQSPSGIRTRRSELHARGDVIDTGEKATMTTGREAILWDAIPAPRATVYEDMTGEVSPSRPPGPERDAMVAQLAAEQDRLFDTPTVRPGHLDLP